MTELSIAAIGRDAAQSETSRQSGHLEAILDGDHPIKRRASKWAQDRLADPDLIEREVECGFWSEGWQRLASEGLIGLMVAPAYGGGGLDLIDALLIYEGLGHGCSDDGLLFACTSQALTLQPTLERFGTPEQKETWLPRLVAGKAFGAFAISELDAGSDAFAMATTAERTTDGYILNGEKAWITMAPLADVFIVFATVAPERGRWGITAFVVDASTPGVAVGANRPKMGMRTTPFANVVFDNCSIPTSARMGAEGAGASIFSAAMEPERGFLLVGNLGALERVIDKSVAHARERHQFGRPIGSFQGVAHQIAEMKLGHETARLLLYKAAVLQQSGTPSMLAAALSKLQASEATLRGAIASMEVHGAKGYVTEFEIERDLRNAAGGVIYGGSTGIQKNIIARLLGLPAGE